MTYEQHRPPVGCHLAHLPQTLLLKLRIANGQDFIDDKDLRLQMRGHRKSEPNIHAARVALNWRIEKFLDFGKGNDLIELAANFIAAHAEYGAVKINVLAPGQLGM